MPLQALILICSTRRMRPDLLCCMLLTLAKLDFPEDQSVDKANDKKGQEPWPWQSLVGILELELGEQLTVTMGRHSSEALEEFFHQNAYGNDRDRIMTRQIALGYLALLLIRNGRREESEVALRSLTFYQSYTIASNGAWVGDAAAGNHWHDARCRKGLGWLKIGDVLVM